MIENFLDLARGDKIIHEKYGVGVYRGIKKMNINGCFKDYVKIEYADGGMIFLQTSQIDCIQKYIGIENVKLNKLGSNDWIKTKTKARQNIRKIAFDLVKLYASREKINGFKFNKDNDNQEKFENEFEYIETNDQLNAIKDIKQDMESSRAMDRLICGDVGYGKTEVAMRAAFKCVQDKKQVAYLSPTTILTQQHYNNFLERFKNFDVNIEMLSRFRNTVQQKKIMEKIKIGEIDIVIGTHKLLSKDIIFKDLGLIIVDEEQRFGVNHKEKLKSLYENVDVLTLSATPIPRTLNISLNNMRDISILREPPHNKLPVRTFVIEHDFLEIKKIISRELDRLGQVYYLCNKIKNIANIAFKIQEMIPGAVVRFAHGRLSEIELENIMRDFINKKIDVLVCTTIIEAGLDIHNANTIIVQDADIMGLAQLYQLRGRVGRSNKLAYAYFTYDKNKILNPDAEKRLKTIIEFVEFGSGFKIAMKDLEIRGAGNLLGAEQSGNVGAIGYDLYCKLLKKEIKTISNEKYFEEANIDLNVNAFISDEYANTIDEKLKLYKNISGIKSQDDFDSLKKELIKKYKNIDRNLINLFYMYLIKSVAQKIGIKSIIQKDNIVKILFYKNADISLDNLLEVANKDKNIIFILNPEPNLKITIDNNDDICEKITDIVISL
ncbi:MAG: transcription-repair coupling factor [Clostridiales bacterium]|jgi:transcription-repair coupling factor (superfamily II helicase)|nr:transcription-repair coupling factor [Clostridiales bacterium]